MGRLKGDGGHRRAVAAFPIPPRRRRRAPPAFPLRTSRLAFRGPRQPAWKPVVNHRPQSRGGDAAAGFREHDLKRMDIGTAVLARVLEVARVGVGF